MYCTALYFTVLYSFLLTSNVLHSTIVQCSLLNWTVYHINHCIAQHCTALHCSEVFTMCSSEIKGQEQNILHRQAMVYCSGHVFFKVSPWPSLSLCFTSSFHPPFPVYPSPSPSFSLHSACLSSSPFPPFSSFFLHCLLFPNFQTSQKPKFTEIIKF